jgi:hypothetical protein
MNDTNLRVTVMTYHSTAQDRFQMIYHKVFLASINKIVPVHINDWSHIFIFSVKD